MLAISFTDNYVWPRAMKASMFGMNVEYTNIRIMQENDNALFNQLVVH